MQMSSRHPESPLTGKVAWVTGGSSGIGAACVTRLTGLGATVGVLDLHPPTGDVPWQHCDLGDGASVERGAASLAASVGAADILVASAGIASEGHLIADLPTETWERIIDVNLTGTFRLIRLTLPTMTQRRWGRIVTIASGTAVRVYPGSAGYAASKAGLVALTKVAASEGAGHGVTANVVAPGLTDTPLARGADLGHEDLVRMVSSSAIANPMGELIEPEDSADAVAYFCLPAARHVTGQTLHVSAGSIMP